MATYTSLFGGIARHIKDPNGCIQRNASID